MFGLVSRYGPPSAVVLFLACASSERPNAPSAIAIKETVTTDSGVQETASPENSRIEELAFYTGPTGPRVLVRGVDPAEAIEMVHLEFFDVANLPVWLDDDGDGQPDPSNIDVFVVDRDRRGGFFVEVQAAPGFERAAHQVAASPVGGMAPKGERHVAVIQAPPARAVGQTCDPQGFDRCEDGAACAPGRLGDTNRCAFVEDIRGERCADAPRIQVDGAKLGLLAEGASLWDPPLGCASPERTGRPEALAWLHVKSGDSSLRIATERSGEIVDTVVTLLPGCTKDSAKALACNDDEAIPYSSTTVSKLEPGDYLIVVDTLDKRGGPTTLTVTSTP